MNFKFILKFIFLIENKVHLFSENSVLIYLFFPIEYLKFDFSFKDRNIFIIWKLSSASNRTKNIKCLGHRQNRLTGTLPDFKVKNLDEFQIIPLKMMIAHFNCQNINDKMEDIKLKNIMAVSENTYQIARRLQK